MPPAPPLHSPPRRRHSPPLPAQTPARSAPAAVDARTRLMSSLVELPGTLDAGLCRTLMLLQPRASFADLTQGISGLAVPTLPPDAVRTAHRR